MTTYDPEEAKKDDSKAFREYKSNFDLLETATTTPNSTGPQRRTRSTQNERTSSLFGQPSLSISSHTPPAKRRKIAPTTEILDIISSAKTQLQRKGREKEKDTLEDSVMGESPSISVGKVKRKGVLSESTQEVERRSPSKGKGKEKPTATTAEHGTVESISVGMKSNASRAKKKSGMAEDADRHAPSKGKEKANETAPESISRGKRKSVTLEPPKPQEDEMPTYSTTRKRRKSEAGPLIQNNTHDPGGPISSPIIHLPRTKLKSISRPNPIPPALPSTRDPAPQPPPPRSPIKRIRLIVRKPPPLISHPLQRPPAPKFDGNLQKLILTFPFDKDLDDDARVTEEAKLRERAAQLRKEGRYFGDLDLNFSQLDESETQVNPQRSGYQGRPERKDTWDHLLEDVSTQHQARKKRVQGEAIAGFIASKIRAYWDAQAVKQDKARAVEEKRLRGLAKATVRMVVGEWRKVIFHIREQERLRAEAEELKRGHEHLDAILNQSGQILETQQGDLARSRSRSGSAPASLLYPHDSDEEEEGEESEGENSDEESGDEEDGEGVQVEEDEAPVNVDVDLAALYELDDAPPGPTRHFRSPSSSPSMASQRSVRPDTPMDEDTTLLATSSIPGRTPSRDPIDPDVTHPHPHPDASPPSRSRSPTSDGVVTPPNDVLLVQQPDKPAVVLSPPLDHDERISVEAIFVPAQEPVKEVEIDPPSQGQAPLGEETGLPPEPMHTDEPAPGSEDDADADEEEEGDEEEDYEIPEYLKPYSVAPVEWDPSTKITQPILLRGVLRPYQASGLEWLASLHTNNLNGILADEMGLGKTIQTISLLAHLACDRGIWGPHLIIVPTSVLLNWEMEFKKFLPGFRILSYHGTTKRRKELRQGWSEKHHFNVCITSYTLASRDAHIFKRKPWYYMILDEAHMIKNFKSQRWNILLMFRSFRRLLLTGTPLQNNLTELWALLQFLMSGANFANLREFGEWFSNPLEKAIEMGNVLDDENMQRVSKLHTVLRPYLLRRLKRDVEKELPSKYEHLVLCPLSKRQRFLYDEFMDRAATQDALQSGVYQKIANILMQLRKVCNHPDLFEVRPIVTSFSMDRSAIADFEIKELLIRRRLLEEEETPNLEFLGLQFVGHQETSLMKAIETRRLDATPLFPSDYEFLSDPPPKDTRTIAGFRAYTEWQRRADELACWNHLAYINETRCLRSPIYSSETISIVRRFSRSIVPLSALNVGSCYMSTVQPVNAAVYSYAERAEQMAEIVDRFAFVTPKAVARDLPRIALTGAEQVVGQQPIEFDSLLHRSAVKLQIAFPDPSLLQFDCGKLQKLAELLREKKTGGHRVLIFTQMTKILDILEIFLNLHGYLYLRLDGATKIEDRQYITERFNADSRVFCFISSSRSGGVGINLTGADTVIFYDSDFNPQMDRQCEDRAHRIGQIRDVHIYRFVSQHTVEEAMLRKANQKRFLDDVVIQKGEFDWRTLFDNEGAITKALGEFEDTEDARAAELAAQEATTLEGADNDDFEVYGEGESESLGQFSGNAEQPAEREDVDVEVEGDEVGEAEEEEGGTVVEYMLTFVKRDPEYFQDWRV